MINAINQALTSQAVYAFANLDTGYNFNTHRTPEDLHGDGSSNYNLGRRLAAISINNQRLALNQVKCKGLPRIGFGLSVYLDRRIRINDHNRAIPECEVSHSLTRF